MDRIRVGVLGFGRMGKRRVASLLKNPRAELAVICDSSAERREEAKRAAPGAVVSDEQAFLSTPRLDAVCVSTPNALHAAQTLRHLRAGHHVFCEKPLCLTMEEAGQIVGAAQSGHLAVQVGANARHFGCVQKAKALLDDDEIGPVTFCRGWIGHDGWVLDAEPWSRNPSVVGGGTLFDNGHHLVDIVSWLFGDVRSVIGSGSTRFHKLVEGQEDNFFGILTSTSGVTTMLQSSWCDWNGYFYLEIYGYKGLVQIDARGLASSATLFNKQRVATPFDFSTEGPVSFDREVAAFLEAVANGSNPIPDAQDAAKVIQVCQGLYQSWRTGRLVTLPQAGER